MITALRRHAGRVGNSFIAGLGASLGYLTTAILAYVIYYQATGKDLIEVVVATLHKCFA